MSITVVFHHGGKFTKKEVLEYEGGSELVVRNQDVDKWNFFEATGIAKDLGYENDSYRLWWKTDEDVQFRRCLDDEDALVIADHAVNVGVEAHIYIEHFEQFYSHTDCANEDGNGVANEDGNEEVNDDGEDEGSDDEIKGIRLDDSEEERTHGNKDGFDPLSEDEARTPPRHPSPSRFLSPGGSRVMINGKAYRVKSWICFVFAR